MNLNEQTYNLIGVDVGGSHISAAFVSQDLKGVYEETYLRYKVDSNASADEIISDWLKPLQELKRKATSTPVRIGIAMPGPFDYVNGVSLIQGLCKYESLYEMNIRNLLSAGLDIPGADISFINDAEAFVKGEAMSDKVLRQKRVIGITLGTGLGSSYTSKGTSKDLNFAQMPFYDGIAEESISTRWFSRRFKEITGKQIADVKALLLEEDKELVKYIFIEFGKNLARFLDAVLAEQPADVIVVGGNIARCWTYFIDTVKRNMKHKEVLLLQSQLWEKAALVGSASIMQEASV